jgi:hypothetical protein
MFPSSPSKIPPNPTLISVKNSSDIPKNANKPEATPKQQPPAFFKYFSLPLFSVHHKQLEQ